MAITASKNGIATWTGATSVMQHKGAATRMAKTAGATQVVNNIKISGDAGGGFKAEPRKVQVKTNEVKTSEAKPDEVKNERD